MEKGTWRFEYLKLLWDYFFNFFSGGKPGKRESADLRLPWDYFKKNLRRQTLKKGVCRFEIYSGIF